MLPLDARQRLAAVMAYLCSVYPHKDELSNARLTKLVYLADWESARVLGRQLTGVRWVFNHYGPWVPDILDLARSDPRFLVRVDQNAYGSSKRLIEVTDAGQLVSTLTDEDRLVLDRVIEQTQRLYFGQFIDYVYSTHPVKTEERYAVLDLPEIAAGLRETDAPQMLTRATDRSSVELSHEELANLRAAVHDAMAGFLGEEVLGEAAQTLTERHLENPTIEATESLYKLDVRIGDQGALRVGTEVTATVEGFVAHHNLVSALELIPGLGVRDRDWNEHYVWASAEVDLWVTSTVTRAEDDEFHVEIDEAVLIEPASPGVES